MKKSSVKIICLALCLLLLAAALPMTALADRDDGYRDRVLTRYEESFHKSPYYGNLLDETDFVYKEWADGLEGEGTFTTAYLWSVDFLLDKNLGTNEYVTYLSNLLNMLEYGFSETAAAQAEYTAKLNAADYVGGAVSIAAQVLPGAKAFANLEKSAKYLDSAIDVAELGNTVVSDMTTLGVLAASTVAYEKKMTVLQAVADHSKDGSLTQAAQDLLALNDLQYIYMLDNYTQKAGELAGDITYDVMEMDFFEKVLPRITSDLADNFTQWLASHAGAKAAKEAAGIFSACAAFYSSAAATLTGVLIGAEIMQMAVGNQAELIREAKAMDALSTALAPAFKEACRQANSGDADSRFEAAKEYVALGEALVYTHLRGDYGLYNARFIQNTQGANEYMALSVENLSSYYEILSGIFPERLPQVIVTSRVEKTDTMNFSSVIFEPEVHIPHNREAAQKINTDPLFKGMIEDAYQDSETLREDSHTTTLHGTEYSFGTSAYTCGSALCISFHRYSYSAGAAHFETSDLALTYDLETGEPLFLKFMVDPDNPNGEQELEDLLVKHFEKNGIWAWTSLRDVAETLLQGTAYDLGVLTYAPRFTPEGLLIQFSPYDIAPFAAGYQSALIPYEDLKGIFRDKYLPLEKGPGADIAVYEKGHPDMPSVANSHGTPSKRALVATATIWDVTVEETIPMGGNFMNTGSCTGTVFYANYMKNELCWLPDTGKGNVKVSFNGQEAVF